MTFSEFMNMGGYGYFVWMCFGLTALLMFGEPILLRMQRKSQLRDVSRLVRINKREE